MGTEERAQGFSGEAGGSRKIIHIDMDAFYASVEQRDKIGDVALQLGRSGIGYCASDDRPASGAGIGEDAGVVFAIELRERLPIAAADDSDRRVFRLFRRIWPPGETGEAPLDLARIGIKGESGGGGFAAAAALYARDWQAPKFAFQHLIYPGLDAIVCGSVAVTRDGRRCGKGEGYSDLEFAILRELGHPPVPVATTVHDLLVVDSVPRDPTDQPLSVVATPTHAIRIKRPSAAPTGIDWTRLSAEILAELKRMTTSNA